jgi:hypothetical protein
LIARERLDALVELAVALDLGAARRRELHEGEAAAQLGGGSSSASTARALLDALGVVEAVDADAEQASGAGRARAHSRAALGDGSAPSSQRTGHSMEMG